MNDTNRIVGPGYYPRRPGVLSVSFDGLPNEIVVCWASGNTWDRCPWHGSGTYTVRSIGAGARLGYWHVVDVNGVELYRHELNLITTKGCDITMKLRNPGPVIERRYSETWTFKAAL